MKEFITIEELYEAYYCCRRNKRNKRLAQRFELDYEKNLCALHRELNDQTYEIGKSTVFCVTRPKLREVFAADFRDRIVHHLIMNRFMDIFERYMITDSYNCREGKGTLYGVERLYTMGEYITHGWKEEAWILKCDLQGFFMSIDRKVLWDIVEYILDRNYYGEDILWWKWIIEKVISHKPENCCVITGNKDLWKDLPPNKSLFTSNGKGLPIGNLTSQIFANLYLSVFDRWVKRRLSIPDTLCFTDISGYGRYVDDFFIISKDKRLILDVLQESRTFLSDTLKLNLHPDKVYLQSIYKGVSFVGTVIKPYRKYTGNRTVNNMFNVIKLRNEGKITTKKFVDRMNSYLGFLVHTDSYAIRWRAWNAIECKDDIYMKGRMHHLVIKKKKK